MPSNPSFPDNNVDRALSALLRLVRQGQDHDLKETLRQTLAQAQTGSELVRVAELALDTAQRDLLGNALDQLSGFPEQATTRADLQRRAQDLWHITDCPASATPFSNPVPGRLAYVLYSSLPYLSTGYAIRSQHLAQALTRQGLDVRCLTRPGFPWDEHPDTLQRPAPRPEERSGDLIDGVPYRRTPAPLFDDWGGYAAYVEGATQALIQHLRQIRPACVMASSNHACALPALRAARALGLPMIYEIRGMWELSRAAREPNFSGTPQFYYERSLETAIAQQADHVFALSSPMRDALIRRGVPDRQISYFPNGCGPTPDAPVDSPLRKRLQIPETIPVIGYAGSFPAYEGLEDLITAAALLKQRGHRFRLLLVGDENGTGAHETSLRQQLMQQAEALGVADRLLLPGRLPPRQVPAFMALFDMVVVPRRSLAVTEMVAPLKPIEAMSAGKPVILSSVAGMDRLVDHDHTGLRFPAGNVTALAAQIERLLVAPSLRASLGNAARRAALKTFSWDAIARQMGQVITHIERKGQIG